MVRIFLFIGLLCSYTLAFTQSLSTTVQTGHSDRITAMQYSQDGNLLLTASMDETIVVWDIKNQVQVNVIFGFSGGVSCFAYNQPQKLLVVGTYDNQVKIYHEDTSLSIPLNEYEFTSYVTSVAISNDGKTIAAASADFSLTLFNDGNTRQLLFSDEVTGIAFANDNTTICLGNYNHFLYALDTRYDELEKGLIPFYKAEGHVSFITLSEDNNLLAFGTNGYDGNPGEIGILDFKKSKVVKSKLDFVPYIGFQANSLAFRDNKTLIYASDNNEIKQWVWKKNKSTILAKNTGSSFALSPSKQLIASASEKKTIISKIDEPNQKITLEGKVEYPTKLHAQVGDYLYVEYPSGLKKWNLRELNTEMVIEKFYEKDWNNIYFSPNSKYILQGHKIIQANGEGNPIYSNTYDDIRAAAFSNDNSRLVFITDKGQLRINKIEKDSVGDNQLSNIIGWNYDEFYANNNIDNIVISPNVEQTAVLNSGVDLYGINDSTSKQITRKIRESDIVLPAAYNPWDGTLLVATAHTQVDTFAREGAEGYEKEWYSKKINRVGDDMPQYINKKSGVIDIWNTSSLKNERYLTRAEGIAKNADVADILFDTLNKRLIAGYTDGTLRLLNVNNSSYMDYFSVKFNAAIKDVLLSEDGRLLFVISGFGDVTVLKNDSLVYAASLLSLADGEYLVSGQNNFYKRSKNTQNAISFRQGETYFKLNQVDAMLNKPHMVMRDLGIVPEQKLDLIERLARNKQLQVDSLTKGPSLEITNTDKLDYFTAKSTITIETLAKQNDSPLDYLKIWLNGVPIYAPNAEPKATAETDWSGKWELPLLRGKNNLRFVVYDTNDNPSQEKLLTISCNKPYVRPNLYVAMISVSEYQNQSKNLKYAVKDGRDFAQVFKDAQGSKQIGFPCRFDKIIIDSFFNENAKIENIKAWKNKLQKTKPEDYVMLYVSGHGLLDDNFEFWFATHDIDFENPANRGMSFNQLEDLLVAIPAQQKLFLMDACHSGEIITDEIMIDTAFTLPDGSKGNLKGYTYRGTEVVDVDGETIDKGELKQELFSNYDSKSGATVISAAAGNSFALESPEWNNGIFTFTVINGLIYRLADANDDGEVSVVELSRYVTKRVKEQTGGLQIPNDRQENIENNFRVW
jgi:WD40 repeat protein